MTDHRKLQRTLFRMQADAGFARALLAGDAAAVRSSELGEGELALLGGVELAALSADPGGKRRTQIAGNATSEFRLTLAAAARTGLERLLDEFLGCAEFHDALSSEGRLPLAFGAFAERRALEGDQHELLAIARLELAMAQLRRELAYGSAVDPTLAPGEVVLSPRARVVELASGTTDLAAELGRAVAGLEGRTMAVRGETPERALLLASAPRAHHLGDVSVELLRPPTDELLLRSRVPLGRAERARFAREQGAEPVDLERFLEGFVADGVLIAAGA